MSMEWDDENELVYSKIISVEGNTLEWDDYGFSPVPPIADRRKRPPPTETDFFRSFLNTTREEHRARLSEAANSLRDANISQRVSSARLTVVEEQEEKGQKQKESSTKTYFDFLLNKRQQSARERIKELKQYGYKMPEGRGHLSFIEDQSEGRKYSGRPYSFPLEADRSLREDSFLRDVDTLDSHTAGSGYGGDLSAILAETSIKWDSPEKKVDISALLNEEWDKSLNSTKGTNRSRNLDISRSSSLAHNKSGVSITSGDVSSMGDLSQFINERVKARLNVTADQIQKSRKDDYGRAYSFPMERDRSLREPSFLRDLTSLSGPHADATYKGELTAILDEGKIDWDRSGKGADISGYLKEDWDEPQDPTDGPDKSFVEMLENMKYDPDKGFECLINDVYYPGVIDDAVNGKIDFNKLAFMVAFSDETVPEDAPPADKQPISLAEAFDRRFERHKGAIKKTTMPSSKGTALTDKPSTGTTDKEDLSRPTSQASLFGYLPRKSSFTRILNREELVLASTVGIDVSTIVQNRPVNELIKAMNSLQKAEYMNDYDKSAQAAEEAVKRAPPELAESAAIHGAKNFRTIELTKKTATVQRDTAYKPVEVVSYMGTTKPMPDVRI